MYAAVPMITPMPVIAGLVIAADCDASIEVGNGLSAFANPKSSTLTVPSDLSLIFAGFKSR